MTTNSSSFEDKMCPNTPCTQMVGYVTTGGAFVILNKQVTNFLACHVPHGVVGRRGYIATSLHKNIYISISIASPIIFYSYIHVQKGAGDYWTPGGKTVISYKQGTKPKPYSIYTQLTLLHMHIYIYIYIYIYPLHPH